MYTKRHALAEVCARRVIISIQHTNADSVLSKVIFVTPTRAPCGRRAWKNRPAWPLAGCRNKRRL